MTTKAISKFCSKCKIEKFLEAFPKNKNGKHGRYSYCRSCQKKQRKENPERGHENYKKYTSTIEGNLACLLRNARVRAKQKNLAFDLTKEFLVKLWESQLGECMVSGVKMTTEKGEGRKSTSASIDRIIPENGYVKSNVRLVCIRVNEMKSIGSDSELLDWCSKILTIQRTM